MTPQLEYAVSPALHVVAGQRSQPTAHEVKFLLTESQARRVHAALASELAPDPHAECGLTGAYTTTTLYCDTSAWDVFHRRGGLSKRKYRIRRYGRSETVFLERKTKQGTRVSKRRSDLGLDELSRLNEPLAGGDWSGDWFRSRIQNLLLRPVLAVIYERQAFVGQGDDGPMRLTFDRSIRVKLANDWQIAPFEGGERILSDSVICEFKFCGTMPARFKGVIVQEQLTPSAASKYRLGLAAAGSPAVNEANHA